MKNKIEISLLGVSSLDCAVLQGDIETVKELIEKGVDINVKDNKGRTPLHYAVGVPQLSK
jgi:ankyrin repeat protein